MRPIITVGVGGSGGWSALAWATEQAAATRAKLVLCHVCPPGSALADRRSGTPIRLLELFDPALARAVASTRTRLGDARVRLRLLPGDPGDVLLANARDADLLVIGPSGRTSVDGTAGLAHRVATRAPCTVVVARPVSPGTDAPFAGHVVVGVDPTIAGHAALEFGFRYADTHRLPLAAVRVTPVGQQPTDPADLALLATEVDPWLHKFPDVPVRSTEYVGDPGPDLLRVATGARLLVVGDHGREVPPPVGSPWAPVTPLGEVSGSVIERAGCPVAVVPGWERPGGRK
ncbi:universal stress protein [Micromonospora polyrhachis]|uniref:Nucleotide-binding universal stress UspA family protein n=1 Tax=Micromonospora polyrhachis TaxID=1282883 RepID=A0A7W7SKV1_9ACTN|nr:universal stress protein [Micromonospora polyrhachis]MBB4956276.1 nucleotide-binding universal stress UspA family protein [Micromonospora polyrhachis]